MNHFYPEGALKEVLERKDLLTKQYRHQRDNRYLSYVSPAELFLSATACDTNLMVELTLRGMINAQRPTHGVQLIKAQQKPAA